MTARLRLAVLVTFVCHAALVVTGRYRQSYDAYTHMFFADHYARHWGTLWEPRWYTGFSVVSYPPLVHQVMALLAHFIGVDAAFGAILLATLVSLTLAVYAFARVFVDTDAAGYAALAAAAMPSLYLTAYTFGQLPTLVGANFALLAFAALARFLRDGDRLSGVLSVSLVAVVLAAHHATLLLLPAGILAVALQLWISRQAATRVLLLRLAVIGAVSGIAGLLVIWPFWVWGLGQTMQTPIDHLSRHNFLTDRAALLMFFLPMYGLFALLIPYFFYHLLKDHSLRAMRQSRESLAAPALAFIGLFVFGLGGTTPLPKLLFGARWEWLTYDRFVLWASLFLLVAIGRFTVQARRWYADRALPILRVALDQPQQDPSRETVLLAVAKAFRPLRRGVRFSALALLALPPFVTALAPNVLPTQPPPVDMRPVAAFLNAGDHSQWRYLTFGFGDQYASLSLLTNATTIDGSYHTARTLPELRQSGIGQIDSALWSAKGLVALDPILQQSASHGVRWGFVNRIEYNSVLLRHGWRPISTLTNGVEVWEDPSAVLPVDLAAPPDDPLQAFSWHVLPLAALAATAVLAAGYRARVLTRRALLHLHTLAVGLLPVGLCLWGYQQLAAANYPRIYFTYTDGLLFVSDVLIAVAVAAWSLARLVDREQVQQKRSAPAVTWLTRSLLALCVWASISLLWAPDPHISMYVTAHLWLLFGFYYSLKDHPVSWRVFAAGAAVALLLEVAVGGAEFVLQSTAFLSALHMKWPGSLDPSILGASVVQLADGMRWLRAYGTLPHPNILGGFAFLFLAGAALWFTTGRRLRWLAALILTGGIVLLCLTFSRSAALGCLAAACILAYHHRRFARGRLPGLLAVAALGVLVVAAPLGQLMLTRVAKLDVPTENQSIQVRNWMTEQALLMIRAHPVTGVGIGNYTVALAEQAPGTYAIEPEHNVLLLIIAELGLPGALILCVALVALAAGILRSASTSVAVVASALLIGLLVMAVFDHYLWSLAPGRDALWLALGLWGGWMSASHYNTSHQPTVSSSR